MFCKYRVILSIDGGGIRGVIPLRILDYLHSKMTKYDTDLDVTSWVDVFSSSSASSIFTGALMLKDEKGRTKHAPSEILDLYIRRGNQIFSHYNGQDPEHSVYPLSFILDHFFGGVTMQDLRNHFLFLSYNQTRDSLFGFSNSMDRHHDLPLSKVMTACSAIPGVFPPLKLGINTFSDAVFQMENPSLLAYDYARMFYPNDPIILISVGTGQVQRQQSKISESQAEEVHAYLKAQQLTDDKLLYYRYQTPIDADFPIDDIHSETTKHLLALADQYILDNQDAFQELIQLMALRAA